MCDMVKDWELPWWPVTKSLVLHLHVAGLVDRFTCTFKHLDGCMRWRRQKLPTLSLVSFSPVYTLPLFLLSPITNTHTHTHISLRFVCNNEVVAANKSINTPRNRLFFQRKKEKLPLQPIRKSNVLMWSVNQCVASSLPLILVLSYWHVM